MDSAVQIDRAASARGVVHVAREIPLTLLALTLATSIEQWTGSGFSLLLTDLTGTLSASADEASWTVTVYSLAFAVSVVLSHRLASYFGNRHLLTLSCALYAATSLGCAASPSLGMFLVFRLLQGFAGGSFLARTLVFTTQRLSKEQRVPMLRIYTIGFFTVGRLVAPVAAGWLADNVSWRVVFLVNIPVMLVAAWLFHRYAPHHWHADIEKNPPDVLGITLLLVGVAAAQMVLSRGEIDDWFSSPLICAMAIAAITGNALFILWQFLPINRHPVLHLRELRDRGLFSAVIFGITLGMSLGGSLYVLPQYLRRVESHSALQTGKLLAVGGVSAIAILLMLPTLVHLIGKFGSRLLMMIALGAQMLSMWMFAQILTPDTPDRSLWLPLLLNGVFMGIALPTVAMGALAGIAVPKVSNARAIYYGSRQLGATLGVAFAVILIDRREALHSSRLLDTLYSRNLSIIGVAADSGDALAMKKIAGAVLRQSAVLTFADVFYAMAALAAATLLLVPLLPALKPRQSQPAVTHDTEPSPTGSGLQTANI